MRPRGPASVPPPAGGTGGSAASRALARVPIPLRAVALMPPAALAVHQLRYWLAYGSHADRALAAQGHSYLPSLTPWLVLLLAMSAGAFVGRLAQAWQGTAGVEPQRRRHRLLWAWLAVAGALILVYSGQELLEGMFAAGHPGGLVGVFGDGGLWAIPSALAVGALLALLLRGAEAAIALAARARPAFQAAPERPRALARPRNFHLAPPAPLASAAAGRAPPPALPSPF